MVSPLSLYCKSYRTDLKRVVRLADSIKRFNVEKIPFYLSVPRADISLFKTHLQGHSIDIIEDELIHAYTPYAGTNIFEIFTGNVSQQLIKSEFWRLNLSKTYLCLDSDAIFIRPFGAADFIWRDDIPYTVMDECHEYLEACLQSGNRQVLSAYANESRKMRSLFERREKNYSFGPFPLVWHHAVWESLDYEYFRPRDMTLIDAIRMAPLESRWYGEALLKYQAIPLMPCQPFFKVYHYAWQFDKEQRSGISTDDLAMLYSGIIFQSAWEREMDWPHEGGNLPSRWARRIRRHMGKI